MCTTALVCIRVPKEYIRMLRESQSLYDSQDLMRYETDGTLPPKQKVLKVLIAKHLTIRGFIKE